LKRTFFSTISIAVSFLILTSCNNQKLEQYQFTNENITIRLPKNYQAVTADKLGSTDDKKLEQHRTNALVGSFYDLQRGDQTLDILENEKGDFHYLILLNTSGSPVFNETTFSKLKNAQEHQYDLLMNDDATIKIDLFDSKFEDLDSLSIVKMKHKFTIVSEDDHFFKTVFFINKSGKTIIVHELNNSGTDSEEFLKTIMIK
tara:strand:+ start:2215 stop:2820 length:606 start_codon:yes stop_codon:yes gene_type:complete